METKQTAIQIAIESYLNDGVSFTDWFSDNSSNLLAMEKEQIKDAWKDSNHHRYVEEVLEYSAEEYYNETYGK